MTKYRIGTLGEGRSETVKELTNAQYDFLQEVFTEVNANAEPYASYLYITKVEDD